MQDRFTRGLIAGIGGGVVMNIWNLFSYYTLNLTQLRLLDWAAIMIYGDKPDNLNETILALLTQLLWSGFLGVLFAYLIPQVTSKYYRLKGAFWGFISGFIMYAIVSAFRMPYLTKTTFGTAISNLIGGVLWGLITAQILYWLDSKLSRKNRL